MMSQQWSFHKTDGLRLLKRGAFLCGLMAASVVVPQAVAQDVKFSEVPERVLEIDTAAVNLGDEQDPVLLSGSFMVDDLAPLLGQSRVVTGQNGALLLTDPSAPNGYVVGGGVRLDLGMVEPFVKFTLNSPLGFGDSMTDQDISFGGGVSLDGGALSGSFEGQRNQDLNENEVYTFIGRIKFKF